MLEGQVLFCSHRPKIWFDEFLWLTAYTTLPFLSFGLAHVESWRIAKELTELRAYKGQTQCSPNVCSDKGTDH